MANFFTVLAFINTTSTSDGSFFGSRIGGSPGGADLRLFCLANGDLRIEMNQGAGFVVGGVKLNDGEDHMVAAVFDSRSGDSFRDVDLYVDGTLFDVSGGTDHLIDLSDNGPVYLGRDNISELNRPFIGTIDDVAIYNEALSLADLNEVAANGVIPELNLFSQWMADPAFGINPADRGFTADPDGDFMVNGVEAWFGTNPGAFSTGLVGLSSDGTATTFTHPRNENPPSDVSGAYEWSRNLAEWYAGDGVDGPNGGPTLSVEALPAGATTIVSGTASEPLGRVFFRVWVMQE